MTRHAHRRPGRRAHTARMHAAGSNDGACTAHAYMPGWRARDTVLGLLAVGLLLAGCGSGERDERDEAGGTAADGTRIELIYVDGDSTAAPDTVTPPAASTTEPASTSAPPPAPSAADEVGGDGLIVYDADGDFTVQVGTFAEAGRASRRVRELVALGYPAYAVAHPQGGQVRVRIGYFATRDAADRFGQRFRRDHGDNYWIDRRSLEGDGQ